MRFLYLIFALLGANHANAVLEYTLISQKICDPLAKKRTIKLGNSDRSALHVTDGRLFNSWTGSSAFDCVFEIQAIYKDELAVVIQNLSLRRDPITNECIDYVQFRKEDKTYSDKYCGEMNARKSTMVTTDDERILESSYLHFKDDLTVMIHIEKRPLEPGEKLDVDIVFTSFKMCSEKVENYAPCGMTKMCIWEGHFFDGRLNCPYYGCLDEKFCWDENAKPKYHINSELNLMFIFVTAAILVVLVVWMYLKCRASFLDESIPPEARCATPCATAPPLEDPKDAPPSYDSLFPDPADRPEQGAEAALLMQATVLNETAGPNSAQRPT
ncbi:uncharacterized protein LOC132205805 [Neocloeon triangulifer]|uniref:uncharacterized protein LOC132205805 n=1 Tax=Neocloeon triangulifer TaxID=2078957 RepID=UPI00286EEC3B|nr:uncharacterized protein LOC132205805 [Neocloeon triangulifer]